jgi:hypothetical protein
VRGKTRKRDLALNAGAKLQKKPRSWGLGMRHLFI